MLVHNIISVFSVFRVINGLRKLQFRIESVLAKYLPVVIGFANKWQTKDCSCFFPELLFGFNVNASFKVYME